MLTVLEAIKLSENYLRKYNIESSRLNAELLLAEILNCKRLELYLIYDKPLSDSEIKKYREFLTRRSKREPLQYIVGHVEFYGYKFMVDPSVLIPRPETELLVETAVKEYNDKDSINILDIGVGSGNISISLLKNLTNSRAVGIDISQEALSLAQKNAELHQIVDRIELKNFDIFTDNYNNLGKFDLIISNPPYVSNEDFNSLDPELKVYEPASSITDYSNGFRFYEKIIPIATEMLNEKGKVIFELGKDQHKKVEDLMLLNGFKNIKVIKDYSNISRIIFGDIV